MAPGPVVEQIKRCFLAELKHAQPNRHRALVLDSASFGNLRKELLRRRETQSRSRTVPVAISVPVVANDGVRLAAARVPVGKEAAAAAGEDARHGGQHDGGEDGAVGGGAVKDGVKGRSARPRLV
ncbi:hypothetical protein BBAD15_g10084 [Beauveria bassiana D1-5]|uniref:Uncharacterized protein n=1 Tax=Beauveria bassiana D1-5 TaxID=1245745 RepID=A0A0A2VF14_BEABA|nr:hypothetical protein BBAD15_g10084 [Beauveria bassiana D1-5]